MNELMYTFILHAPYNLLRLPLLELFGHNYDKTIHATILQLNLKTTNTIN
jgi:hypothetical protein